MELLNGDLLSVNRSTREVSRIAIPAGTVTPFALSAPDLFDAAINEAGTHIVYIAGDGGSWSAGKQLRLYDLAADDGVGTLIKEFDFNVAWPCWLADRSILIETGDPQSQEPVDSFFVIEASPFAPNPTTPTTGTFTLTFRGDTTSSINWDATSADVVAALELLPSIGAGNIVADIPSEVLYGFAQGIIQCRFSGIFAGTVVEAPTITDGTDGGLATFGVDGGIPAAYGDNAGQFSAGDILRLNMAGSVLKTYTYDRAPFDPSSEGLYTYAASIAADKLWLYGENDDVADEASALVILSLRSGATLDTILPLNDFSETSDQDISASAIVPFFGVQYGGVTQYTQTLANGTIRTSIGMGGQPKGGYKRWRPTLPVAPPTPLPTGGGITTYPLQESLTILAAAFTDTAIQIPANVGIYGVDVLVTTVIPTAATFDVGIAGNTTKFATGISTSAASTDPGLAAAGTYNATAVAVRITPNLTPGAATGRVRVTINYFTST
jgi:hypothetical protein